MKTAVLASLLIAGPTFAAFPKYHWGAGIGENVAVACAEAGADLEKWAQFHVEECEAYGDDYELELSKQETKAYKVSENKWHCYQLGSLSCR